MSIFYIWLIGIPVVGVACSFFLAKKSVVSAEDIGASLGVSIMWPVVLLGAGIGWLAKLIRKVKGS